MALHQVERHKSNFVYGDYKLIVELSDDAHWFWRATEDVHGTTSNRLAMDRPERWKDCIIQRQNGAQWTFAQTIPKAVADASMRQPRPQAGVW